ncbi:MAG: hypothetical protein ABWW69_01420 [Pyrodictiaceae archaeon]
MNVQPLFNKTYDGDLTYIVQFPNYILGGSSNPREFNTIFEAPLETLQPITALLELEILAKRSYIDRLRLWFNSIAVAREIKPMYSYKLGNEVFNKIIFNVKPLIEGRRVRQYPLRIYYDSQEEIRILKLALLLAYSAKESKTIASYAANSFTLNPAHEVTINIASAKEMNRRSKVRVTGYINGNGSLAIDCCGDEKRINVSGIIDIETHCLLGCGELKLKYLNGATEVLISSVLAYTVLRPEPEIEIALDELREDNARIIVSNKGNAEPDNAILMVLAAGNITYRKSLNIPSNSHQKFEIPIKKGSTNIVRVIWRYRGETRFTEAKIKACP